MRGAVGPETTLDGREHHVADVRAGNAGASHCDVGDDLPVERVDDEGHPDPLAIPAADLQGVGAPPQVRGHDGNLAIVDPALTSSCGSLQRQAVLAENAQNPLAVDRLQSKAAALPVQKRRDAAVAVGRTLIDEATDRGKQGSIFRLDVGPAGLGRAGHSHVELGPAHLQDLGHPVHREPSLGGDGRCHVCFFARV